jgi:tetratricopeptide (TPR) repeat protein
MSRRKAILFLFSVLLLVIYSRFDQSTVNATSLPDAEDIDGSMQAHVPPVDEAIKTFHLRIKQNPQDAVSYTLLGELYIRQARETGDVGGYQRAETALSEALNLLPGYSPASASLASVYYAQHDFTQALKLAQEVYSGNPKNVQALAVIGDAQLALGNYREAEAIYQELSNRGATPPVLARLAALAELQGKPEEALQLMRRAAGDALHAGGTRESVAWYLLRVAEMYFNNGEIKEAGNFYEASLRVLDNYHLALAGLGKVRFGQGKYDHAIAYFQQASDIIPQPDHLATLGDLYMLADQPAQAQQQFETVEYIGKLAALNQQIYNRQLANFYSDHDLKLKEALRLALAELEIRKDIYGYDAVAWAYYKNGNFNEAQAMMEHAMVFGTLDARLYYHAGMIAHALGSEQEARRLLEQALAINPYFDMLQVPILRTTLNGLAQP